MKPYQLFLCTAVLMFWSGAGPVIASENEGPELTDARAVMAKFSESRKDMNSYIVKADEKCTFTYPEFKGTGTGHKKHEWRFDGQRCKNIMYLWGDINIKVRNVKEEEADYLSMLWDGQTAYIYNRAKNPFVGKYVSGVIVDRGDNKKICSDSFKRTSIGELMGYHWGDDVRIDELFLQPSATLRLRDKKNNVRGVDCYVLDASVPGRGAYTVWIDPVHDFHITRIRVQRKSGDRIYNDFVRENATHRETFEVVEFEKINDVWLAKICIEKRINHSDDYHASQQSEITFTSILLNPDHEKLGSFLPDDIPNGTQVQFRDLPPSETFTWQDGDIISDEDDPGND